MSFFSLADFKILSLSLVSTELIIICIGSVFSMFLCSEFVERLGSVGLEFSSNLYSF